MRPKRERTSKSFGPLRVLWWDLGGHGRAPSSAPDIEIRTLTGIQIPTPTWMDVQSTIVEAHDLRQEDIHRSLTSLLEAPFRPPVLLITAFDRENARRLNGFQPEGLAWAGDPEEVALDQALRLITCTERRRMADQILRSCPDPTLIKPMVKVLFLDSTPPSRVQDLARACHICPRALDRNWKAAWTGNPPFYPKTLADWAVALRARELAQMGVRPQEIHKALGIHQRTLERIADRLAGMSSSDWLTVDSRVVWERASETVLNIG